ncbi:MAG: cell wall-binding repeat-containing protein [Coriobacteriia bacterium]|nr:cell wall-binding repeat-containing protein [Coriobacteriia bacterium]
MRHKLVFALVALLVMTMTPAAAFAVNYYLPWTYGRTFQCTQGNGDSFSHYDAYNYYAWDFGLPFGEPVRASAAGTVVGLREDAADYVANPSLSTPVNYVLIQHSDGTRTGYYHLKQNSIPSDVGLNGTVRAGQIIGACGASGYVFGAHLHFSRFNTAGTSIALTFTDAGVPIAGRSYTSGNVDQPTTIPANIKVPGYAGFAKYGTAEGWRAIGGGLYGTGIWTYSGSGTRDNYARWTFDLSRINGARKYKAEAYVTSTHAGTTSADYHINTASGLVHKSVNQLVLSNQWANLGSYSFALGSAWVELDDVTGDGAGKEIAFDAIRLTPYFNLKYIAGTGGTIVGTTTQSILSGGSGTAVTAKPNTGFRFVKWSDGSTAATRTDTNIRADKTLTASFEALGLTVTQIAGTDRITTAIEASKKAFPSGASTVVIATAFNWPDALGGSALAGAMRGPILLVAPNSLSPAVAAEIDRLNATKVIILGGTGAVSNDVHAALDALSGVSVERIAGANRYETSEKIAARTIAEMKARSTYSGRAFVSTGQNFPDALGASPLAAAKGWPIYLIDPAAGDNSALATRMKSAGVTNAVVLGGTAAVSTAVESRMRTTLGAASRIAGDNRYQTAVNVASYGVSTAGLSWNRVGVATGQDFPDALAGGVLQGVSGSVMVLTPSTSLDANVRTVLVANKAAIAEVRYLGGTGVVTTAVRTDVEQALR